MHLLAGVQGQTIVSPTDRALLHPLAIPLAKGPAPSSQIASAALRGPEAYTCLLQYKVGGDGSSGGRLQIVHMSSEALAVSLLARNTDEYLHRWGIDAFRVRGQRLVLVGRIVSMLG